MDKAKIREHLDKAEEHLQKAKAKVSEQRKRVQKIRAGTPQRKVAEETLKQLKDLEKAMEKHRDVIRKELDTGSK